jgi:ribose-phosphate pyrophosphokinase
MIDTGGSVIHGAEALLERGAAEVYAACTHGVLSGDAPERLLASPIKKLIVTDTIPLPCGDYDGRIVSVSVAGLLADAIRRIHCESSVSEIFSKVWKAQS